MLNLEILIYKIIFGVSMKKSILVIMSLFLSSYIFASEYMLAVPKIFEVTAISELDGASICEENEEQRSIFIKMIAVVWILLIKDRRKYYLVFRSYINFKNWDELTLKK